MSKKNTSDSYEVGYGKPSRDTQFQKGVSGNPKGRPKKTLDFDQELLRQSRATVTINENGSCRRISKHGLVIKQLINNAIRGNIPAARAYLDRHEVAAEKVALREAVQPKDLKKCDVTELTNEELDQLIFEYREEREQGRKKELISNAD